MTEKVARGHIERDPRPTTDIGTNFALSSEARPTFALSEADVLAAAYAGYIMNGEGIFCLPDDVEYPSSEKTPVDLEQHTDETTIEHPQPVQEVPLHMHPDGTPKMMHEAESAEVRAEIIRHTWYGQAGYVVAELRPAPLAKREVRTLTTDAL